MKTKDISNIVNDYENITFYQLIQILVRVKIKVLLALIGIFLTYSFGVWRIGYKVRQDQTAIDLAAPFTLILKDDAGQSKIHKGLHLMPDSETEDNTIFVVRKREPSFESYDFGTIVARRKNRTSFPSLGEVLTGVNFFGEAAYAQTRFQWYGHQLNEHFYEKRIDKYTIRRFYDDGWILEYKIDTRNRNRSIPRTLKWVRRGNPVIRFQKWVLPPTRFKR